jgi:NAD(P)H dehydrogenase (quinone)
MYAITGITGKVGGELARTLLAADEPVRAIVRDASRGRAWVAQGCELALANMNDRAALTNAFTGADAVFILPPAEFDPEPGYPEAQAVIEALVEALLAVKPRKALCLSTIGADAVHDNLLSQRTMMETALRELPLPLTILRPAWFLDNASWDLASACETDLIHSFLQPTDKAFPMVAAKDVGRVAADLIREDWACRRVIELEGPSRVTPNALADAFTTVLGKAVRAVPVPRESWDQLFRLQGMRNPEPRIRMLDGFNEGWIEFRDGGEHAIKGRIDAVSVVADLVAKASEDAGLDHGPDTHMPAADRTRALRIPPTGRNDS